MDTAFPPSNSARNLLTLIYQKSTEMSEIPHDKILGAQ